uniref:Uncharacterized protein n=1 Tax=Cyprinus carpio TaxID=7962 RepID=A0A8C1JE12_CYPCA
MHKNFIFVLNIYLCVYLVKSTSKRTVWGPNMRIVPGTKQNILLEGHKLSRQLTVGIAIYDYPVSQTALMTGSATLRSKNNYSALKTIKIDPNLLQPDGRKKYVKLVAQFGAFHRAERVLPVSFRSGYIFIQTDKPVYNPGDTGQLSHAFSLLFFREGRWKVVAKFEFEVKKYSKSSILPSDFLIQSDSKDMFQDIKYFEATVCISSRYLYGEPVKGVAYVLFGIEIDGEKKRLTSMKQLNDLNGGHVSLTMEEIKKAYLDTNSLLGSSVYVKASVMTSSGSDLVEAEKYGIKIVMSPYMLSIRDAPKYFKPGLPLAMTVIVSDHNGSPAHNTPVKISFLENPITVHSGTIKVSINVPAKYSSTIVKTADPSLKPEQQAVQEMRVESYVSFMGYRNYLHISVGSSPVVVGSTLNIQAHIKPNPSERRKLVLSKGNIIHAARINVKDLVVINIPLLITSEMLPAFRFVAYYILPWQHNPDVVADSVFVDVEDRCVGSLSVGPVEGEKSNSYSPGSSITFEVKGDPGAKVSLVAVDNAIFLLSKNRLTQKKVWEVVGHGDMGCTAGGGKNNMGVFSDAGLMFHSSTGGYTDYKKDCSSRSRRRRSAAKLQLREQLEKAYSDEFLQRCCMDGMREIPMPYSCYRRSLYITEDWSCVLAFLRCLREDSRVDKMKEEEDEVEEFDEDDLADLEDIYVRSKFFESWLWTDIRLPSIKINFSVFFSGFCVAEPYNVQAWKPFFIDLRLPHLVSRNEHVEIKAVVHNYRNSKLEVMVILEKTEDMCSVAFSGQHRQQVSVPAGSSKLISYTIIPLKTGELPLQVTAVAASFMGQDAVRKNLCVVVSELLKPAVIISQLVFLNIISSGDLLADSIDNSIKEDSLAALIRMPGGCVEQNLARITLPLIATHYLDRRGNWDAVGIDRREEAIKYIQTGYKNQLNYRKKDDSYPPYAKEGTSTWITAYVVKVFSMAKSFISVNEKHLCGPLVYLLKNKQRPDGSFQEDNPVYTTSMTGGLRGSESRVSLTAFVLIALAEAQNYCSKFINSIRAALYLRGHFPRLTRPYTAAIACYALAVSNHGCMKSILLNLASPDRTHWPDSSNYFFTLEATGYALLALIKGGHMEEAAVPFQWLNEKRGIGGGYGSTQSTMVVLQALSEYLVKRPPPQDLNLLVQLSVPGRSDVRWTFNPKVAYVARSSRVALEERQVRMAILDISLPTGFEPENSDLELLTNSVDRYINNFQVVDSLSDRGSLIIHLFKVSSTQMDVISFRLHQKFKVGLLQPSTVTVYQYYNKDKRCSRFYSPPEDKEQLDQICKDNVCRCSQGQFSWINFEFSINFLPLTSYKPSFIGDCCVMKEDSSSFSKEHRRVKERRMFLSHASCRTGLGLREGQEYLIIGPITDVWHAGSTSNKYVYMLGKDTWVEHWPSESECGAGSTLKVKCGELKSFAKDLTEKGCQT